MHFSSPKNRTLIIAEAGVNHNGSLALAKELIDCAYDAKADVVKFQTFQAKHLVTRAAQKAPYQIENTGKNSAQFEMLKELELTKENHFVLKEYCEKKGIGFLSTPFDVNSAKFLIQELGLSFLKIPSGELTNAELLVEVARLKIPLILSTGMSDVDEIWRALNFLAFGYLDANTPATNEHISQTLNHERITSLLKNLVTLLHCTTQYPTPHEQANLKAIPSMRLTFDLNVGYSDHTLGISASLAAVALGAQVIEKHFTLNRNLPGPDHRASLEPIELQALVQGIREVEVSLGSGEKRPNSVELPNLPIARKSLVAAAPIQKGEVFTRKNLTTKRPGTGISAFEYWNWLGKKSTNDYEEDDLIQ